MYPAFAVAASLPMRRHYCDTLSARRVPRCVPRAMLPGGDNGAGLGRLHEWSSSDGDRDVQDVLAKELMRATRHVNSEKVMDERIASGMAGVTELLAELYLRTERELEEQHADLARKESIPQLSKWNRTLMDSHKESKRARVQISEELAEVQSLLRRVKGSRSRRSASGSSHRRRRRPIQGAVFTVGVTALVLGSFESVAARENGPVYLAQIGSVSLLLVLLGAHLHAVRSPEEDHHDPCA